MVTGPWVAHLVGIFESSLKPLHNLHEFTTHHVQGWSNQANFGSHVQLMTIMTETVGIQFIDKDSQLYHFDTKEVIEEQSAGIVKHIGDQTRGSVPNRKNIWHHTLRETNQYLTPSKNEFFIFNKHPVQQSLTTPKEVVPLKNDCTLFSFLYITCQTHKTLKSESRTITV